MAHLQHKAVTDSVAAFFVFPNATSASLQNHQPTGTSHQPPDANSEIYTTRWRNLFNLVDMSKRCPYRWFSVKPRIAEKLSDCLVFCIIFWQTDSCLSGDCQPIVWMVCWLKELSSVRNRQKWGIVRWKECRLWVIQTVGMACVGRILKTGICVLQH